MITPFRHKYLRAVLSSCFLMLAIVPTAARGEEMNDTLGLFTAWQEGSVTATRAPKPLSHTAETVTVVTRRDIEAVNAHTLGDILATLTGVQIQQLGGSGSVTYTFIQGSNFNHVLVLLDGIPLNNSGNFSDVGLVPARIIERVEVIKGPASSVWGQALGGVINVTTREPAPDRTLAGSADSSIGTRATTDSGGEVNGTTGRLGYFLSGGYLRSDGLRPNSDLSTPTAYGRLTWQLPGGGRAWGTFGYSRALRGDIFAPLFNFQEDSDVTRLTASLGLRQELAPGFDFEVLLRHATDRNILSDSDLGNLPLMTLRHRYRLTGASTRLSWRGTNQLVVGGMEYEHANYHLNVTFTPDTTFRRNADRWGIYLNDTIELGPVSIIPGGRFDHTEHGDQWSPSFGAVWRLTDSTLLRGYVARGFSLPDITVDRSSEKTWTARLGVESEAIPYLWVRGTLFRSEVWDFASGSAAVDRWTTYGAEAEARTAPVLNTSLSAGYAFMDSRLPGGGSVQGNPRHSLNLSLQYDDRTFRGTLTGRQVNWNSRPEFNGRYHSLLIDLHLGATLIRNGDRSLELFFSGRNLFNASMYPDELLPNAQRCLEGGMKVSF